MKQDSFDDIRELMGEATDRLSQLQIPVGEAVGVMADVATVRRRRQALPDDASQAGYLTLVMGNDGLLDWQVDGGPSRYPQRRAARRGLFDARPIDQVAFKPVQGSEVAAFLKKLDDGFNDRYGLFDINGDRVDQVVAEGRILLLVHGTFSKSDAMVKQLRGVPDGSGSALLNAAKAAFDQVLVYEHPTLSVSPVLNAIDLARAFSTSTASIDIVAHSRGGLVVRWWLEALSRNPQLQSRAVFCGSPLMGTALASPYRLRTALKLLTNLAFAAKGAAEIASLAVPLFAVVQGLMTLVASGTAVLAKSPIADAAVAMIPGLSAQSRYGPDSAEYITGNYELEKLGLGLYEPPPNYFIVRSNFESEAVGWQFWKAFRRIGQRIGDAATDVVFSGENDLVVDTSSMGRVAAGILMPDGDNVLDYGTSSVVHHLNYFSQPKTAAFIRKSLAF